MPDKANTFDQIAETIDRFTEIIGFDRREAMQQQELRRARAACFAVEHIAIVDLRGPIVDGGHDAFPLAREWGRDLSL
jgi:hypothetical protein